MKLLRKEPQKIFFSVLKPLHNPSDVSVLFLQFSESVMKIIVCLIIACLSTWACSQSIQLDTLQSPRFSVSANQLPPPYNILLTQPLMTPTLEKYYQRKTIIQPLFVQENQQKQTYSRVIIMLVDTNKSRDNPTDAITTKETKTVELAFITINFQALSNSMQKNVRETNIPFGALLRTHHVNVETKNRAYFKIKCDEQLNALLGCPINHNTYGRMNTIVDRQTKKWLAQVTEILL